jgi:hypothetical protein
LPGHRGFQVQKQQEILKNDASLLFKALSKEGWAVENGTSGPGDADDIKRESHFVNVGVPLKAGAVGNDAKKGVP